MNETKNEKSPAWWIMSAYFAEGLPFVAIVAASALMFKNLGISDTRIAFWTSLIILPWTIRPLWGPFLEMYKTKKFFVVLTQLAIGVLFGLVAFSLSLPNFFAYAIALMAVIAFCGATHDMAVDGVYLEKGRKNILGLQGQLWGETIRTAERIEYLLFPRMVALAERAWSKEPSWAGIADPELRKKAFQADWNEFANRLGQVELPRLDELFGGIRYRIPLPGAKIENGLLSANAPLPGMTIRYTTDGTEPTAASPVFGQPVPVKGQLVKLKIFNSNGHRGSRTVMVKG